MSTAVMWLLLFVVVALGILIAALSKTKFTTQKIATIGIMAALSFVAYEFFRYLNGGPPGSRRGTGGCCRTGLEAPLGGALRCGQRLFDGKIQLSVLDSKELYFNVLPLLQKVMYIVDIAVGDLRNMYQAGLAALQGHESAEFCNTGDLAL